MSDTQVEALRKLNGWKDEGVISSHAYWSAYRDLFQSKDLGTLTLGEPYLRMGGGVTIIWKGSATADGSDPWSDGTAMDVQVVVSYNTTGAMDSILVQRYGGRNTDEDELVLGESHVKQLAQGLEHILR